MDQPRAQAVSGQSSISRRTILKAAGIGVGAAAFGGLSASRLHAEEKAIFYSATAVEPTDDVSKLFTKKTGIPIEYFRGGSNNIAQKFEKEMQANQVRCSVVALTIPTLVKRWADQGLVLAYDSPAYASFPAEYVLPKYYGPIHGEPDIMAYNAELVPADQAPKKWEDLLDPKWKNKLVMTDGASSAGALHWFAALRSVYGKEFMKKLAAQNVLIKTGGAEVGNSLVSGERQVAAMITQGHAQRAIGAGGKLRIVVPDEGAPILYTVVFIPAKAPNPEAGKKFLDFVLGEEAQVLLDTKHFATSLRKGMPWTETGTGAKPLSQVKALGSSPADLDKYLAQQEELVQEYTELFK